MSNISQYILSAALCIYSAYGQDQVASSSAASSSSELAGNTSSIKVNDEDIALISQDHLTGLGSAFIKNFGEEYGLDELEIPLTYFSSVDSFEAFRSVLERGTYAGESPAEVKDFLDKVDYLGIDQVRTMAYLHSLADKNPLLLYELYKERKQRNDGSEQLLLGVLMSYAHFIDHQRLGVVDNRDPAAGHTVSIKSVAVIDANTIVTGSRETASCVWHKDDDGVWRLQQRLGVVGNQDPAVGHTREILIVRSLDTNTIVTISSDRTAIVWHKDDDGVWRLQQRLGVVDNQNPAVGHTAVIKSFAVPDSNTIITVSFDKTAIVWHKDDQGVWRLQQRLGVVDNQNPAVGHTSYVDSISLIDADTVVTLSIDHAAILWHRDDQGIWRLQEQLDMVIGQTEAIKSVTALDNNTIVAVSIKGIAIICRKDAQGQWQPDEVLGYLSGIDSISVIDVNTIVSISSNAKSSASAIVWHRNDNGIWRIQQRLGVVGNQDPALGHIGAITSIAKLDNSTIVTASYDHTGIVWHKDSQGKWHLQQKLGVTRNADPEVGHTDYVLFVNVIDSGNIVTASYDHTGIVWHRSIEGYFEPLIAAQNATSGATANQNN